MERTVGFEDGERQETGQVPTYVGDSQRHCQEGVADGVSGTQRE